MEEYYDFLNCPDAFSTQTGDTQNFACPHDLSFLNEHSMRLDDFVDTTTSSSCSSAPCTPDSERIPNFFPNKSSGPVVIDEPQRKKYKSKESERNRRNRINERLTQLKDLLPRFKDQKKAAKDSTKEEIIAEAIQYINKLHSLLGENSPSLQEDGGNASPSPSSKRKPAKRARIFMSLLFMIGVGLWVFPFVNPPQNHPLYAGSRIPRHHSNVLVLANDSSFANGSCYNPPDDESSDISSFTCPKKSMEDPPLEDIFKSKPRTPSFYCSLMHRRCTPQINVFVVQGESAQQDVAEVTLFDRLFKSVTNSTLL